jgi:putative redox protein
VTVSITATVDTTNNRVEARRPDAHLVSMDSDEPEGVGQAAGPKEVLLAALAGCTSMDVASILRKKRQAAASYEIVVSGEEAAEHPRVFTTIQVEHRIEGDVTAEALRRAIELSATRYCPVSAMLSAIATIEHRYVLTGADGARNEARVVVTGPAGRGVP